MSSPIQKDCTHQPRRGMPPVQCPYYVTHKIKQRHIQGTGSSHTIHGIHQMVYIIDANNQSFQQILEKANV